MSFSLNEVEVTAKKAARGAGYSWGMAEEAGKATRWLCEQGQPGCEALSSLLEAVDGKDLAGYSPRSAEEWAGSAGFLCPLNAGVTISDFALLTGDAPFTLRNVIEPLLLLPFLAAASARIGAGMTLSGEGFSACAEVDQLWISGQILPRIGDVLVSTGAPNQPAALLQTRAEPDSEAWAVLNHFAHRTYAPATEESRMLGAGAGVSDND